MAAFEPGTAVSAAAWRDNHLAATSIIIIIIHNVPYSELSRIPTFSQLLTSLQFCFLKIAQFHTSGITQKSRNKNGEF